VNKYIYIYIWIVIEKLNEMKKVQEERFQILEKECMLYLVNLYK